MSSITRKSVRHIFRDIMQARRMRSRKHTHHSVSRVFIADKLRYAALVVGTRKSVQRLYSDDHYEAVGRYRDDATRMEKSQHRLADARGTDYPHI